MFYHNCQTPLSHIVPQMIKFFHLVPGDFPTAFFSLHLLLWSRLFVLCTSDKVATETFFYYLST